ncbi:2-nitropropane dioxygenase [Advenella kashmirensis WT001]|uniref:Propionate 3-nitronate monooxygenase n=1 Tax=Advenella kashmirensis (strain DSM 17095 / LMG 22695 / WT001) TaxID=1036672 RepID=I3U803_ADVKW|nr:2-nitropropane dioxygenase [Advenella kashmirensis WT001]
MSKSLVQLLNTTYPLIQAPMAGVSTPALAAAVSEAGALGSLGLASASLDQARSMITEVQRLTRNPVNINFFCHRPTAPDPAASEAWLEHLRPMFEEFGATPPSELKDIYRPFPDYPDMLELVLETRPAVVSFHFGLPSQEYIDALKNAGIVLMASATTPAEARQIEAAGIDVLVAQGYEAGGHRACSTRKTAMPNMAHLPWCICWQPNPHCRWWPPAVSWTVQPSRPRWRWAQPACNVVRRLCCVRSRPPMLLTARPCKANALMTPG